MKDLADFPSFSESLYEEFDVLSPFCFWGFRFVCLIKEDVFLDSETKGSLKEETVSSLRSVIENTEDRAFPSLP